MSFIVGCWGRRIVGDYLQLSDTREKESMQQHLYLPKGDVTTTPSIVSFIYKIHLIDTFFSVPEVVTVQTKGEAP